MAIDSKPFRISQQRALSRTHTGFPIECSLHTTIRCKDRKKTLPLNHAKNDIAGEWKEALEKEGLQVDCRLEGLGEIPEIQDLYLSHIRSAE